MTIPQVPCDFSKKLSFHVLLTHRGTLWQLFGCNQLNVQVFALRFPSGFDQPLQNLWETHTQSKQTGDDKTLKTNRTHTQVYYIVFWESQRFSISIPATTAHLHPCRSEIESGASFNTSAGNSKPHRHITSFVVLYKISWVKILAITPTLGEDTLTWTIMGANEVLMSCAGWLMVSASSTTSCRERASSKILSISLWTSARKKKKRIGTAAERREQIRWVLEEREGLWEIFILSNRSEYCMKRNGRLTFEWIWVHFLKLHWKYHPARKAVITEVKYSSLCDCYLRLITNSTGAGTVSYCLHSKTGKPTNQQPDYYVHWFTHSLRCRSSQDVHIIEFWTSCKFYQGWSACWISQWWPSYLGCLVLTSWPRICRLLPW